MAKLSVLGALVAVGLAPFMVMVESTRARLLAVVFGAALVFQSSSDLSVMKLAYLGVLGLVLLMALGDPTWQLSRVSLLVGVLLVGLSVIAILRGNQLIWVVRDASNYFLLLAAAPLAVHFGRRLSERFLRSTTLAAGFFGAYAFTAQWTDNRGLASLPAPGVPSTALFALAVAGCSALAVRSPRSGRWWALTAGLIAAGLVTGTRNMLLMVLAPIAIAIWSSRRTPTTERRAARRALRSAIVVVPIAFGLAVVAANAASVDVRAAANRIASVATLDQKGSKASLEERKIQQDLAWGVFRHSPLVGTGPGTIWEWVRPTSGTLSSGTTLDTSFVVLGKWGLIGTLGIAYVLLAWWRFLRPLRLAPTWWGLTMFGVLPVIVLQGVLAPVVEDRGLPIVLILLGAGTFSAEPTDLGHDLNLDERQEVLS
jgi:O-antigen ligase